MEKAAHLLEVVLQRLRIRPDEKTKIRVEDARLGQQITERIDSGIQANGLFVDQHRQSQSCEHNDENGKPQCAATVGSLRLSCGFLPEERNEKSHTQRNGERCLLALERQ